MTPIDEILTNGDLTYGTQRANVTMPTLNRNFRYDEVSSMRPWASFPESRTLRSQWNDAVVFSPRSPVPLLDYPSYSFSSGSNWVGGSWNLEKSVVPEPEEEVIIDW